MTYLILIILSYLLGSVPMGLILVFLAGKGDVRKTGSHGFGATNVMRAAGFGLAALTWILDMAKAIVPALIGRWISGDAAFGAWCGFFAVIGHCYPWWMGFRASTKGVSAIYGVMLAVNPLIFLICGIEWLIVTLGTGFSSMGALVVMVILPLLGFMMGWGVGLAFLAMAAVSLFQHRKNIQRLLSGHEDKIKWKWHKEKGDGTVHKE